MFLHVIIDGRGVLREREPELAEGELVGAAARWAGEHPRTPIVAVVFDGSYGELGPGMHEHDERTVVVATHDEPVGDVIVGEVEELRAEAEPVIVVTSRPELRDRVEALGAKVIASDSFLRTLRA